MSEMSPAEEVFFAALEKATPAEQAAYLDEACAGNPALRVRVEKLLAAHPRVGGFLESESAATGDATGTYSGVKSAVSDAPSAVAGIIVAGKYKLLQQIGEGGMGSVWMADQTEPVKRRVAVKLIRVDRGSSKTILSRFEVERQAIALMDHPHIAKLLDAGTTDAGQPYFVMELVKGIPLTEYCDVHKLSIPDRLNLFMQICSAVQHAHQKGIIHRDLKPTNILVESHDDKPVPKVIDFGLAKATSGMQLTEQTLFTAFGTVMGTPLYMAPEQAKFNAVDVDTRADVYALGVILYELLTGTTPIARDSLKKAALDEMLKLIREQEAPTPSSRLSSTDSSPTVAANRQMEPIKLGRFVKGELDWIVMKSLSKERDRRYETANGFARDIERFLNHEPVQAGPPNARYRLRKFVRRNRGPVVTASLVALSLVAGIAGTTAGQIRAEHARAEETEQRRIAQGNEARADAAAAHEREAKEREAKERARAEGAFARAADVLDAMTSEVTGESLTTQKVLSGEQRQFLTEVLTYYREFAAPNGDDERSRKRAADAAFRVGLIECRLGRAKEAATAFRAARDGFQQLVSACPHIPGYRRELARSHNGLGVFLELLGQGSEAGDEYRKALTAQEQLIAEFPSVVAYRQDRGRSLANLGSVLRQLGEPMRAEEQHKAALSVREKLAAEFPNEPSYRQELAISYIDLGNVLEDQGKLREASEKHKKALAMFEQLVIEFPFVPEYREGLGGARYNWGIVLAALGQRETAAEQFRKALDSQEKLASEFPAAPDYRQKLAAIHNHLGSILAASKKWSEAEGHYRKALALFEKLATQFPTARGHQVHLGGSRASFGAFVLAGGAPAASLVWFDQAIATLTPIYEHEPRDVTPRLWLLRAHTNRARAHELLRQDAEAVIDWERAVKLGTVEEATGLRIAFASALIRIDRPTEGERALDALIRFWEERVAANPDSPGDAAGLAQAETEAGLMYVRAKRAAEAADRSARATQLWTAYYARWPGTADSDKKLRWSHLNRAIALNWLDRPAEAIAELDRSLEYTPEGERRNPLMMRVRYVAKTGDHVGATARAAELLKNPPVGGDSQWFLWDAALAHALAITGAKSDESLRSAYAEKAIALLRRSIVAGFDDLTLMNKETDLDALRNRADFKELVAELERKFPPPPERAPPPREKK